MFVKLLELGVPDVAPYDRDRTWFETFIGTNFKPIIDKCQIKRYWFTRYNSVGQHKFVAIRFEADDLSQIDVMINALQQQFNPSPNGYFGYKDYFPATDDIGTVRFLSSKNSHQNSALRADLAFDFLHASARLFIDCLVGPDSQGYYIREPSDGNSSSKETTLEQFHHLLSNMTGVPAFVIVAQHPIHGLRWFTRLYFLEAWIADNQWQMVLEERLLI